MRLSDMYPSKYLSSDDLKDSATGQHKSFNLSILSVSIEEVGDKERKPVIFFQNAERGMVLNRTNADHLAFAYGDDTDAWIGKPVTVYFDPSVMFAGKRTGGLRLQPMNGAAPAQVGAPVQDHQAPLPSNGEQNRSSLPGSVADDDIPF